MKSHSIKPMRVIGDYSGAARDIDGDLVLSFKVPDEALQDIEKLKDKKLVLEIKKYSEKRSLNANAYFWVLCDEIAKVLRTTKESIYAMQLSRYGVFVDVEIIRDALPMLKDKFRYVEEVIEDNLTVSDRVIARCYFGSSGYNKEEMARLIDGTVQDAKELGIDTWTEDEIARVLSVWEGAK